MGKESETLELLSLFAAHARESIEHSGKTYEEIERLQGWSPGHLEARLQAPEELRLRECFELAKESDVACSRWVLGAEDGIRGRPGRQDDASRARQPTYADEALADEIRELTGAGRHSNAALDRRLLQSFFAQLDNVLSDSKALLRSGLLSRDEFEDAVHVLRGAISILGDESDAEDT